MNKKYKTWKEFLNGNEFREHTLEYLELYGDEEPPPGEDSFEFNGQWYGFGDMNTLLWEFQNLVDEPKTKYSGWDLELEAFQKEKEIANEPIVLMKIREKLKLEKIKTDFE